MQEQLSIEPPLSAPQLPSIWLHDTEGHLQEVEDLLPETGSTPLLSPASDSLDELSPTDVQILNLNSTTSNHHTLQDREDHQLFPTAETQINNNDFSLLILDKPAGGDDAFLNYLAPDQAMVRRLSQEVELLTTQNEALNQRNQEMLNQLTEADREIERLKAELSGRYTEPHHLPEVEQQGKTRLEKLETELNLRNQELLDAQMLITSLEENLREAEALLQLNDAAETQETKQEGIESKTSAEKAEGYLLRCFEATEAKLMELERQLNQSELTCRELQQQNTDLKEAEILYCQRAAEVETDIRRLNEELEKERLKEGDRNRSVSGEEKIQQVTEGMIMRLKALGKLLEVIDKLDFIKGSEQSPSVMSQLKWEEEFWSLVHNKLKDDHSNLNEPVKELLNEATECMILEKQMLLGGHDLLLETEGTCESNTLKDLDNIWYSTSVTASENTEDHSMLDCTNQLEHFKAVTQIKISLLNQTASSSISTSVHDKLQLTADRLYNFHFSEHPWFISFIHSAATEALYCCYLIRLQSKYERSFCCSCADLMEENTELKIRLANLEEQQVSSLGAKINMYCQTDEAYPHDTELESEDESTAEERGEQSEFEEEMAENEPSLNGTEIPLLVIQKTEDEKESDEVDLIMEMELISALRERVKELEDQLSALADQMKEEFDGKMSCVQMMHEKELEKLKVGGTGVTHVIPLLITQ